MAERIRTQIQNTWIFRMTGQGLESVLMNLVEARLQLFALVCAVFKNPLVQPGLFHSRIGVDTSSTDFSGWHM